MESPKTEEEKLQMFFDGELAPDEEAAVRRDLESSPELLARLRQWEHLRAAMQSVSTEWTGAVDSDALFARIEAEIEVPASSIEPVQARPPVLRVVPGRRERRIWGAVVATGLAAAAAILLAVLSWPAEKASESTPVARGSEVVEVDFGANTGTIFEVEGGAGESLAVVWIDDEQVGMP